MKTFSAFIFSAIFAAAAFSAEPTKGILVKLSNVSRSIEVPDKKVRELIVNELGETVDLKFLKEEEPQYIKDFEATKNQATLGFLVLFLGDLIDAKAESLESKKKSDVSSKEQLSLSAYASLREQIALNWVKAEALKRNIKTSETAALSRVLSEELTVSINKKDIEAFFKTP